MPTRDRPAPVDAPAAPGGATTLKEPRLAPAGAPRRKANSAARKLSRRALLAINFCSVAAGLALAKEGLARDDFEVTAMEPPAIVAAFASMQVDGAALWYPLIDSAKKGQPDLVELYSNEDFIDTLTFPSSFVAGPGRAAKDKGLASSFISVVKSSNDYRHENQDTTIALTATFLKLKEADMAAQAGVAKPFTSKELEALSSKGTVYTWLASLQEQFKDGKISDVVEPKSFYNAELYVNATAV